VDFDYDANGNRVRKTEPLTATGYLSVALQLGWDLTGTVVTDYLYDYENRLTEVTRTLEYTEWVSVAGSISGTTEITVTQGISEAMHADYVYDGYGRRVAKLVTTAITETAVLTAATVFTREYVFDGLDPVYEYDFIAGAITPTVESAYVYANGRMLLMERTEEGASETYWYHYDGLGSVVALTDETGADVCQWKYDEYGNLLQDCPALNHYTYTGQEYDAETGLLHFFARYYDADVGVWLTQDVNRGDVQKPVTLTRYTFVGNDPINRRDIDGFLFERLGNLFRGKGWKTDEEVDAERAKAKESIFVVGGEEASHRVWSNFMHAAQLRLKEKSFGDDEQVTVLIFEEPYRARAETEGKDSQNYLDIFRKKINKLSKKIDKDIHIEYVGGKEEFINYINKGDKSGNNDYRSDRPVKSWEYFGHGTSKSLGVEYAYGESSNFEEMIGVSDVQLVDPNAFVSQPYFKSWGCNTANGDDSWLVKYHERMGGKAVGANKKTDYEPVGGWFKSLPTVVDGGDWVTLEE
jgi:RHS repeat-associated protein